MSLHRRAAKRDSNEPEIIKRFRHHRWHCEQVSQSGMPDLIAMDLRPLLKVRLSCALVDVKDGNGQPTPAQVKKWTALHALGIPVYVVRTEADVDALVGGTLAPWERKRFMPPTVIIPTVRVMNAPPKRSRKGDAAKARKRPALKVYQHCSVDGCERGERCGKVATSTGMGHAIRPMSENYTPPRSKPVARRSDCEQVYHKDDREPCTYGALDAAKEAEVFAPANAVADDCGCRNDAPCALHRVYCEPGAL